MMLPTVQCSGKWWKYSLYTPLSMSWFLLHTLILTSRKFQTHIFFTSWVCPISTASLIASFLVFFIVSIIFFYTFLFVTTVHPNSMKHCTFYISWWLHYNFHVSCPLTFCQQNSGSNRIQLIIWCLPKSVLFYYSSSKCLLHCTET
jgi:hypothetical protein